MNFSLESKATAERTLYAFGLNLYYTQILNNHNSLILSKITLCKQNKSVYQFTGKISVMAFFILYQHVPGFIDHFSATQSVKTKNHKCMKNPSMPSPSVRVMFLESITKDESKRTHSRGIQVNMELSRPEGGDINTSCALGQSVSPQETLFLFHITTSVTAFGSLVLLTSLLYLKSLPLFHFQHLLDLDSLHNYIVGNKLSLFLSPLALILDIPIPGRYTGFPKGCMDSDT